MKRTPLGCREVLQLDRTYHLHQCIGAGSSCLVYEASFTGAGGVRQKVLIRELYPLEAGWIRQGQQLIPPASSQETGQPGLLGLDSFGMSGRNPDQQQFIHTYQMMVEISQEVLGAQGVYPMDLQAANGTLYIVQNWQSDRLLLHYEPQNLQEVFQLALSACRLVEQLHARDYVLLDLKPDNLLVLPEVQAVCLIDFDSIVSVDAPGPVRWTPGFSAPELMRMTPTTASDVYGMGALVFWMIFSWPPRARDGEHRARYPMASSRYADVLEGGYLERRLSDYFHSTLSAWPRQRWQTMAPVKAALEQLIRLSDPRRPEVRFWKPAGRIRAYGREAEVHELEERMHRQSLVHVYGLAGIGKTTLVMDVVQHRPEVLFLYPRVTLEHMIADDGMVSIAGVHPEPQERIDEYARRKLKVLKTWYPDALFVLDQLEEQPLDVSLLMEGGWSVLMVTRAQVPGLEGMEVKALDSMPFWKAQFQRQTGVPLSMDQEQAFFRIASASGYHTLLLSLFCGLSSSHPGLLEQALHQLEAGTLGTMESGSLLYHNHQLTQGQLSALVEQLLLDTLGPRPQAALRLLSLFARPVDPQHVMRLCSMEEADVEQLKRQGWYTHLVHPLIAALSVEHGASDLVQELLQALLEALVPHFRPYQSAVDEQTYREVPLPVLMDMAEQMLPHLHPSAGRSVLLCHLYMMMPFRRSDFYESWQQELDQVQTDPLLWYRALDQSIHYQLLQKDFQGVRQRLDQIIPRMPEAYALLLELDWLEVVMNEMAMQDQPLDQLGRRFEKMTRRALRLLPKDSVEYESLSIGYLHILLNNGKEWFAKRHSIQRPQTRSLIPAWALLMVRLDPNLADWAEKECLAMKNAFLPMDQVDGILIPLSNMYLDLQQPERAMDYLQQAKEEALKHAEMAIWQKKAEEIQSYIEVLQQDLEGE